MRRRTAGGARAPALPSALPPGLESLRTGGKPLSASSRGFFEPRFGRDLAGVRVHRDQRAAGIARAIHAKAFAVGSHVVLDTRQCAPDSMQGRALLAHELTHTLQQGDSYARPHSPTVEGASLIQRQPSESRLTAQDIVPFGAGRDLVLTQGDLKKLRGLLDLAERFGPKESRKSIQQLRYLLHVLTAFHARKATVTAASPDVVTATITGPVTIPAHGPQPERTVHEATLTVRRTGGTFELSLSAREGEKPELVPLAEPLRHLTAAKTQEGIALTSQDFDFPLRVSSREEGNVLLQIVPPLGEPVALLGLDRLDAPESEVQRAMDTILARRAPRRRAPPQELAAGVGGRLAGGTLSPVLTTSWQIGLPGAFLLAPFGVKPAARQVLGEFLKVPVEVQLQYAPSSALLASVTSGAAVNVPRRVPLNLRLVTGVTGGRIEAPREGQQRRGALGLTLGLAGGVELKKWRLNLRYEYLWNFVADSPGSHSLFATFGRPL